MPKHLPAALFYVALAYVLAVPRWPSVVAVAVLAALTGLQGWSELRREKIHDADRKNLAALVAQVDAMDKRLTSAHQLIADMKRRSFE